MANILILTEGGRNIGFGHIARCLSLCQGLAASGADCKMIINGEDYVADLLEGASYSFSDWLDQKEKFLTMLPDYDVVIIDSYLAGINFYQDVAGVAKKALYFDDDKRLDYPRGVVLNGAIGAENLHYPRNEGVFYLLGSEYISLRKVFWDTFAKEINPIVEIVTITFGGDDFRNMTPKVLEFLTEKYPNIIKQVIIGRGFENILAIEANKDENTELIYQPKADHLKEILAKTDIAICAGGQTLCELACMGVPSLVIGIVDNQLNNIEGWRKVGFVEHSGWWQNENVMSILQKGFLRLQDEEIRRQRSVVGQRFVDGKGSLRVGDFLLRNHRRN